MNEKYKVLFFLLFLNSFSNFYLRKRRSGMKEKIFEREREIMRIQKFLLHLLLSNFSYITRSLSLDHHQLFLLLLLLLMYKFFFLSLSLKIMSHFISLYYFCTKKKKIINEKDIFVVAFLIFSLN